LLGLGLCGVSTTLEKEQYTYTDEVDGVPLSCCARLHKKAHVYRTAAWSGRPEASVALLRASGDDVIDTEREPTQASGEGGRRRRRTLKNDGRRRRRRRHRDEHTRTHARSSSSRRVRRCIRSGATYVARIECCCGAPLCTRRRRRGGVGETDEEEDTVGDAGGAAAAKEVEEGVHAEEAEVGERRWHGLRLGADAEHCCGGLSR